MNIIKQYEQRYENINFERLGLFRLLRAQAGDVPVIYLGSSIHISPSFVFSHVRYCDNSPESRGFFSDITKVQEYASSRREYAQKPHMEFFSWDYQTPPPGNLLPAGLVISIYSPGGFQPAAGLVRPGGFLLYQPLPAEQTWPLASPGLAFKGLCKLSAQNYQFFPDVKPEYLPKLQEDHPGKNRTPGRARRDFITPGTAAPIFKEQGQYLLFRHMAPSPQPGF